jgi:hypothetical protein
MAISDLRFSFEDFLNSFLPSLGSGNILNYIFRQEEKYLSQEQLDVSRESLGCHLRAGKFTTDETMG